MSNQHDGGPASALYDVPYEGAGLHLREPGMSMLDFFAAAALQGMLASRPRTTTTTWWDAIAAASYDAATAMLAERERREKERGE